MKPEEFSSPGALPSASRRTFLKTGLTAGGALLLGFRLKAIDGATAPATTFAPDAFIRIDPSGAVTLIMPQVEMGQGVYTSIPMIIAEELDAKWDSVRVDHAPPSDALYGNPTFKEQMTGNSNSIRAFWMPLRKSSAAARAMLVEAAAKRWKVDASTCATVDGEVVHAASNRRLGYGELVADASRVEAPKDPPLKDVKDFRLIGKPLKRLDTPDKTNGKAQYGIDAMPEGLKFATLRACPVFGGKVAHVDDAKAKQVPGVRQVVVLDDLVAVVGDHMWAAKQGLDALDIAWNDGEHANVTTDAIWTKLRAASENEGLVAKTEGDFAKGAGEGEKIDAAYEMPLLAHATMEPLNCTVHVTADSCEVWLGTQVIARAQKAAAKLAGLPLEKVTVHNHVLGGGFGRRLETDYVEKAVRIAQKVDGPVKVVYTREEDIRQDIYRPAYRDVMSASLANGRIVAWRHRVTGSSVMARFLPPLFEMTKHIDIDGVDSAVDEPYDIANLRVEFMRDEPIHVPTGFWRGVGPNNNVFAVESFVDELAKKAGKDPVEFRRGM
ncbi:MAG TPA: molybdopterin cofactor-binding domain-containing protein, partial [Rhodanobacteraceae bacterium]|nr:molybdopterin cofactor-binding domain-containing protein [Rhodanobacteraceae bacterium]